MPQIKKSKSEPKRRRRECHVAWAWLRGEGLGLQRRWPRRELPQKHWVLQEGERGAPSRPLPATPEPVGGAGAQGPTAGSMSPGGPAPGITQRRQASGLPGKQAL